MSEYNTSLQQYNKCEQRHFDYKNIVQILIIKIKYIYKYIKYNY